MIAPGRLHDGGKRSKAEIADYVLVYRNQKLAVIEAIAAGRERILLKLAHETSRKEYEVSRRSRVKPRDSEERAGYAQSLSATAGGQRLRP